MVKFGTFNTPNLTISQIHLEHDRVWSIQGQTRICSKLARRIWDMVRFGVLNVPNSTIFQINLDRFGTSSGSGIECSKFDLFQINLSRSNWDMVKFGLQQASYLFYLFLLHLISFNLVK